MASEQSNNASTPQPVLVTGIDGEDVAQRGQPDAHESSSHDATAAKVLFDRPEIPTSAPMTEAQERTAAKLREKISALESKIATMQQEKAEITGKLKDGDAARTVKDHIRLLHQYNEIKDVGMGLLGMIAEQRGVRVKEVMEEFAVGEKD